MTRPAGCWTALRTTWFSAGAARAGTRPRRRPASRGPRSADLGPEPADVGGETRLGGLADHRGAGRADDVEQYLRVDGARVEVGVPVGAGVERVPGVVAVHQVDPAGDRLDPVRCVGQVDARRVRVTGVQAEPDLAAAPGRRAHALPEPGDRVEPPGHRAVAARGVLDEQR